MDNTTNLLLRTSPQVVSDDPRSLNAEQAAAFLGIHEATLVSYSARDFGPVHRKVDQCYVYDVVELERWLRERQWYEMGGRCERNTLPRIVGNLFRAGAFRSYEENGDSTYDALLLAVAVEDAWSSAEHPEDALKAWMWR